MMKKILLSLIVAFTFNLVVAQDTIKIDGYKFTVVKELPITSIKNQANSGTCWSFSGLAFFESELLRMGKPEYDLSEMFVVHHSYTDKADKYVRMNGTINFAGGGSFYDVLYVLQHYGITTEKAMNGLNYGEKKHKHGEMDALAKAIVQAVVKNPNKKITPVWKGAFSTLIDGYLGKTPEKFNANGVEYSPKSFVEHLGLELDDYVSLTSFTHHPFYSSFALEIPDNWRWALSYNLPLNEFEEVFDYAIDNGYTIAWGSDVSEKGFSRSGVAVMPETDPANLPGTDQAKWLDISDQEMATLSDREIAKKIYNHKGPKKEVEVTQELRQVAFDSQQTTDDHGMQIYGKVKDQDGNIFYMVKNSWSTATGNKGVWYASKPFVLYKTMNILVHKDAIPKHIRKKLKL